MEEVWCDKVEAELQHIYLRSNLPKEYRIDVVNHGNGIRFEIYKGKEKSIIQRPVAIIEMRKYINLRDRNLLQIMRLFGEKFEYQKLIKCWEFEKYVGNRKRMEIGEEENI